MDASAVTLVRTVKFGASNVGLGMTAVDDKWIVYKRTGVDGDWQRMESVAPFDSSGAARSWINFLTVVP